MSIHWIMQSQTLIVMADRARSHLEAAARGAVDVLLALGILLVGWILARVLSAAALWFLRGVRVNEGVRGLSGVPPGEPWRHEPSAIGAWAVYWIVVLLAVLLAADTLGFNLTLAVSERLRDVLPRIIVATFMLAFGVGMAVLLGNVTRRMFEGTGLRGSRFRGQLVSTVLTLFAVLLALEQLGLAAQFIMAIVLIVIAAAGIGIGLAFGLGCRDLARDFVVEYLRSLDRDGQERAPR